MRFARILNLPDMLFFMKVVNSNFFHEGQVFNLNKNVFIEVPSVIIHSESQPKLVLRNLTKNILVLIFISSSFPGDREIRQHPAGSDHLSDSRRFLHVRRFHYLVDFFLQIFFILYFLLLIPRICPPFGTYGRPLVGGLPGIPIAR